MSRAGEAVAEWRRLVDHDRYGPMTADDASFTKLTGLVKLRYAARRLGVTPNDLRGRIETGTIRGRKLGSIWYVSESEVDRYAQRRLSRSTSLTLARQ